MKVSRLFLLIGLSAFCASMFAQSKYDASKDYLVWKEGYLLHWDCYKGEVEEKLLSEFEAITYVSFLPIGKPSDAKVVCVFDAKKSWTNSDSQSLLNHQQVHFDLGELYARRIRRDLKSLLAKGELNEQTQLMTIERNYQSYSEDFMNYDLETAHGVDEMQQQFWARKIFNELLQLSDFKID